jgi:hypothetical protein
MATNSTWFSSVPDNQLNFLTPSDVSTALVAAVWGNAYGSKSLMYDAYKAYMISVVSRLISSNYYADQAPLSRAQKNQVIVGIFNTIEGYRIKRGLAKSALSGIAIDLIGSDLVTLIGMDPDKDLFRLLFGM